MHTFRDVVLAQAQCCATVLSHIESKFLSSKTFIPGTYIWRHGAVINMLVSIKKVALHRARLLLGWVMTDDSANYNLGKPFRC